MTITIAAIKHLTKEQNETFDKIRKEKGFTSYLGWTQAIMLDAAALKLVYVENGTAYRADMFTDSGNVAKAGSMLPRLIENGWLTLGNETVDGKRHYVLTDAAKAVMPMRRPEWAKKLPAVTLPTEVVALRNKRAADAADAKRNAADAKSAAAAVTKRAAAKSDAASTKSAAAKSTKSNAA